MVTWYSRGKHGRSFPDMADNLNTSLAINPNEIDILRPFKTNHTQCSSMPPLTCVILHITRLNKIKDSRRCLDT
jgi:hypothetical protein